MFQKEDLQNGKNKNRIREWNRLHASERNFSWYSNLTDLYVNPANGRKNTAKYVDALIKGCVTAPAEVAKLGLKYFDEQEDLATPGDLAREIESFLSERKKS